MFCQFSLLRAPVSVNETYKRGRFGPNQRGLFLSSAARVYRTAVAVAALAARPKDWPRNAKYEVEIRVIGARHDVDAPAKLTLDALEGVLYQRDSQVVSLTLSRSGKARTKFPPTITITVMTA